MYIEGYISTRTQKQEESEQREYSIQDILLHKRYTIPCLWTSDAEISRNQNIFAKIKASLRKGRI